MNTMPQILIVGYGEMGHALQALLEARNHVEIWPVTPEHTELPDNVLRLLPETELVCIPAVAHVPILRQLFAHLTYDTITLSVAKGVDDAGYITAEILAMTAETHHPWGVLCGPMISHEIMAGKLAYAQAGIHDPVLFGRIARFFSGSNLRLNYSPYPQAASWCAVLKNVYAPLFGIVDELQLGDNVRGWLLMAVINEMDRLVENLSGIKHTVFKAAGLADLMTTVTSPTSHHRALGRRIARGDIRDLHSEGTHTLAVLNRLHRIKASDWPLYEIAVGLVTEPLGVPDALRNWLSMVVTK
ncbi:MAG: hypothetical protein ACRETO_08590 [Gammaproteobacteria bacterium]